MGIQTLRYTLILIFPYILILVYLYKYLYTLKTI